MSNPLCPCARLIAGCKMASMTDAIETLPLLDPFTADDPFEFFRRAGTEHPVARLAGLGAYLINDYHEILAALKNPALISATATLAISRLSSSDQQKFGRARRSIGLWMGGTSREDHRRLQQLLKHYFTPGTVERLRPRVRQMTNELLDKVQHLGRMDVVADLAFPLPANIIADLLGMPREDYELLRLWSNAMHEVFLGVDLEAAQDSIVQLEDYLRDIVVARRRDPRQDLITMFVEAERAGRVTEDEIVANCGALLFAGHETTAFTTSIGLSLLMAHPEQLAMVKARPELIPRAVEEILRFDGPTAGAIRQSVEPVVIAGYEFPAGEHFFLSVLSANRDPRVFADPNRFDITRIDNGHLTFGIGVHFCLGAALARLELSECFGVVLERLPNLRPASDAPPIMTIRPPLGRWLDSLPVEF
jgi:cytochrome P450